MSAAVNPQDEKDRPPFRGTGGNQFIDHDAQIEDVVAEVRRGLIRLRDYAERTGRALDLGAISVETSWTNDARLISVSVTGDLQGGTDG